MRLVLRILIGFPPVRHFIATAAVLAVTPAYADVVKGIEAYRNGDFETALREFQANAEAGDRRAQYNLGVMLLKGNGVQKDINAALKWHRRSAKQGYAAAQHGLGVMYYRGDGVAQDQGEAADWFRKAAEQGFAQAELNLGVMYFAGQGLPKDAAEVVKWITLAAAKGLAEAQFRLGTMYAKGLIFRVDQREAVRWIEKASKQGHIKSTKALAAIKSTATDAEPAAQPPAAVDMAINPTPAAAASGPKWRVQLASVRSASEADLAWRRLKERHPKLLGDLAASTVEADLGPERGIYHRLSAGPLHDRAAARALCRDIKARAPRQGCLPVSR